MSDGILGFSVGDVALIAVVTVVFVAFSYAPVIFSINTALRRGQSLEKRVLFVVVVTALSYGLFTFAMTAFGIPASAFMSFVLPQLVELGHLRGSWFVGITRFMLNWWWLVLPPLLAIISFYVNRYLAFRWNRLVAAARD